MSFLVAQLQLLTIALLSIALQQFLIMASDLSSKCHDILRSKCLDLIMREVRSTMTLYSSLLVLSLTVALYSSLLVLSSASTTGGLDVLESEPRMNVVTAADTSPSIVRNSKEDVGLHLLQWIVFVHVSAFVSMLLWIQ